MESTGNRREAALKKWKRKFKQLTIAHNSLVTRHEVLSEFVSKLKEDHERLCELVSQRTSRSFYIDEQPPGRPH